MTAARVRRRGDHLPREQIFELLSNERRRGAIHYLKREHREAPVDELVDAVVDWERGDSPSRASVYSSMVQTHLPRMAEAGVVEYDREENVVRPTERLRDVQFFLEYSPGHDIPWAEFYLGLAAVSTALLTVVWLGIYPFEHLGGMTVAAIVVGCLFTAALVHVYQTHRHRLGGQDLDRSRLRSDISGDREP